MSESKNKLTLLEHLQAAAEKATEYTDSRIGDIAGTVAEVIGALDEGKTSKGRSVALTIPVKGWASDEVEDDGTEDGDEPETDSYPYYLDIPIEGLTAKDRVDVTVAASSASAAEGCGLCPTTETLSGALRLRSASEPTETITAEYWVIYGKE
jgi:hypothetical protein